ncbi:MAG: hypothetical protein HOL48_07625 [Porticoccaceae bacterium]|jgi:hypothetical protein|nr:hypothetical protein [Porticoccaceae bacterium]
MAFRAPEIGGWYIDLQLNQHFEVVAFDDHERTIEIQYVDGELSEVDMEGWRQMSVESAAAPEDWSASYEVSREDGPFEEMSNSMNDPLATLESELFEGSDPF